MTISFAFNQIYPENALKCEFGQMLPMNNVLVWKSMAFFGASFVIFIISIISAYFTRLDVIKNRVHVSSDPQTVNIIKDFTPLLRECSLGAGLCLTHLVKRSSLLMTTDIETLELVNYCSFIIMFLTFTCYRF